MQIAGAAAAGANGKLTGQMGLGTCREGRDLLVPDVHPFDLALAAQRVGEPVQAIADDAVNSLHAGRGEYLHKLICYASCHPCFLPRRSMLVTRVIVVPEQAIVEPRVRNYYGHHHEKARKQEGG